MTVYAAPASYNLAPFASGLMAPSGQKNFLVIGDSINNLASATSLGRARMSLPWKWNGYVQPMFSSTLLGYASTNSNNRTVQNTVVPGSTAGTISGSSSYWPITCDESRWSADPSGSNFGDFMNYFKPVNTNTPVMDCMNPSLPYPLFRDGTRVVTARAGLYTVARSVAGNLTPKGGRHAATSALTGSATGSAVVKGSNGTYQYGEASCGSGQFNSSNVNPGFQWTFGAGIINAGVTDSLVTLGVRFMDDSTDGVLYLCPISNGGWNAADHVNTAKTTDAAIIAYFTMFGIPTHIWMQIGQNPVTGDYANLDGGSTTSYKANVNAIVDRYNAIIVGMGGEVPRWCLVSQYATSASDGTPNSFNFHDQMAKGLYEICVSRGAKYSFLNTFLLVGGTDLLRTVNKAAGFIWAGDNDMIHPAPWAGEYFVQAEAREVYYQTRLAASSSRGTVLVPLTS